MRSAGLVHPKAARGAGACRNRGASEQDQCRAIRTDALPCYACRMSFPSTIFLADDAELDVIFPRWARPLEQPESRRRKNPFTGEDTTFLSWVPEALELSEAPPEPPIASPGSTPIPPVIEPEGGFAGYQQELEERAPLALRALAHAAMKNVFGPHFEELSRILGVEHFGRPARVGPGGLPIDCLPRATSEELCDKGPAELVMIAEQWAARDEFAAFGDGDDALWVLERVQALARLARGTQRHVCVFIEP
jgi:hypothetical protein